MSMNSISFHVPSEEELMESPLVKFMAFSANDCGKDVIVNWVHIFFLKAKAAASK